MGCYQMVEFYLLLEKWVIGNHQKHILIIDLIYGIQVHIVGLVLQHKYKQDKQGAFDLCGKKIRHHKFPENFIANNTTTDSITF
jgi:hypothetical protein